MNFTRMTGNAAGSKKRASAASSAPSKKSKINNRKKETKKKEEEEEEEVVVEEEQTPGVGKNPTGKKSEVTSPLLVFAHGAGANSSHEWMVRCVHSYPHVNFWELESFRS